jgi:hypothetical protein
MKPKFPKFPQVLTFREWEDLYSRPNNYEFRGRYLYKEEVFEYPETDEMKLVRQEVLNLLDKHRKAIIEVEEKMIEYVQLDTIKDPSVYIAVLKDTRNPEFENVTAKTFWPLVGGGYKEIRIYLGRLSEFVYLLRSDITTDKTIKEKAHKMMKDYLSEKYKIGALPKYPPRIPDYILKKK